MIILWATGMLDRAYGLESNRGFVQPRAYRNSTKLSRQFTKCPTQSLYSSKIE